MNFLRVLRTVLFMVVFYGLTVLAVLIAVPIALIGQRMLRRYVRGWAGLHKACCRWTLGISTRVEGEVPTGPILIVAKHQSFYEPIELLRLLGSPAAVMKRQLAAIPGWGWVARRYGVIAIDRDGGGVALRRMMREAEAALAEQRPILIFPEGTRVPPGTQPPLQAGFVGLYRKLGVPVVPVALDSGLLWPRHGLARRSGVVTMRFGAPIPPGLPRHEIEAAVHRAINALESPLDS